MRLRIWSAVLLSAALATATVQAASQGGPLPGPLPLFPSDNWWNADISSAPVDANSGAFIPFMGGAARKLHPDFGGEESSGSVEIYGIPYILVDGTQPKVAVQFDYSDESDGVDHNTDTSFPFYPIPPEAITQPHWIEGGFPGNSNVGGDRHMLIVDTTNKHLYELYAVYHNGTGWEAGSGAFYDLNSNAWPRPLGEEGWTSADAAGLAILPGLVRYDEVYTSPDEIEHAFRVTVSSTNGYVYPGSHVAGSTSGALPMGARLRLKASKDISGFSAPMQKIFRAMKKHGLIVADNGSNMYITGTFDTRWDNGVLNPAFEALTAGDFEIIQLGWQPPQFPNALSVGTANVGEPATTTTASFQVTMSQASADTVTVNYATVNVTATAGADYTAKTGVLTFAPTEVAKTIDVTVNGDTTDEPNETFTVRLSSPVNASIANANGTGTIVDDDPPPQILGGQAAVSEGNVNAVVPITLSAVSGFNITASYATANGSAVQPADYTAKSGTISIPAGSTGTSVTVAVRSDTLDEPNEAFLVNLSAPSFATVGGAGQVTILDDDGRAALCLPVITLPTTITAQGNYCLVQNLSTNQTTGAAVTINTDFASLDLKGFKIGGGGAGLGTQAVGVYALNRKNITIKNGNIRGFLRGVYLQDNSPSFPTVIASQGHLIHGLLADQNTLAGIHVMGRGNMVRQNQVVATTGTTSQGANPDVFGILTDGPGSRVLRNDVTDTLGVGTGGGFQIRVGRGSGGVVEKNRMGTSNPGASTTGLHILNTQNLLAVGNRFTGLAAGINFQGSTGPYRDNVAHGVALPYSGGTDAGNNQ